MIFYAFLSMEALILINYKLCNVQRAECYFVLINLLDYKTK